MWIPSLAQWIAFAIGLVPVVLLSFPGVSAFVHGDRQVFWPVPVLLAALIALATALTLGWLESKR